MNLRITFYNVKETNHFVSKGHVKRVSFRQYSADFPAFYEDMKTTFFSQGMTKFHPRGNKNNSLIKSMINPQLTIIHKV